MAIYEKVDTVKILNNLRIVLENNLPKEINESAFYVDLADLYEVSQWYIETINSIINLSKTSDELETAFIDIETQMLLHWEVHAKSLKKTLPKVFKHIGKQNKSMGSAK